jgi:phosphoribosylaminoimidazole-succinocarboxamide synthase
MEALLTTKIPDAKKLFSGKVRDIYQVDKNHLLIVSTDRLSAFDHVFAEGIPGKGIVLNQISNLWFSNMTFIKNHIVETDFANFPKPFSKFPELLKDRAVIVKKANRIDFECVVRGYLIGSGWKDYSVSGEVCGVKLPQGLKMAEELSSPIFTPSTKATDGHDMNVSIDIIREKLGSDTAESLAELSIKIYEHGRNKMKGAGILLADTKLEFGILNNEIILVDEAMTPDSSRFWDKASYKIGESPVSYDKQIVRDYLETTDWDKNSPPPPLPEEIIQKTKEKYEEILRKIVSVM